MSIERELQDSPGLVTAVLSATVMGLWWLIQRCIGFVTGSFSTHQKQIDKLKEEMGRFVPREEIERREDRTHAKIDKLGDKMDKMNENLEKVLLNIASKNG